MFSQYRQRNTVSVPHKGSVLIPQPQTNASLSRSSNILYHLDTKFDLDTVKSVGNTLLREYTLELLPEQNALSVRREVPANKPPDDRFTR